MAFEEKKDFNAMLHDSKDMPKIQVITDKASIEKCDGNRMYFAPPIDYDTVMKKVPFGKVTTVGAIRDFSRNSRARISPSRLPREFSCQSPRGQVTSAPITKRLIGERSRQTAN